MLRCKTYSQTCGGTLSCADSRLFIYLFIKKKKKKKKTIGDMYTHARNTCLDESCSDVLCGPFCDMFYGGTF